MGKNSIRVATVFFTLLLLAGAWFGVLYSEEKQRMVEVAKAEQSYLEELQETDRERKAYFENVALNRKQETVLMEAARLQYEELLKTQGAKIATEQKTTTQVVEKPVTKTETVKVAKPKSTRKSKTS